MMGKTALCLQIFFLANLRTLQGNSIWCAKLLILLELSPVPYAG
jgi:hypothetical protein